WRRKLVVRAVAAAVLLGASTSGAIAQTPVRIGYLDAGARPERIAAFRRGLSELGYRENDTIVIEFRSSAGRAEPLASLAAELVRLQPRIIVASSAPAGVAMKQATPTIP